MDVAHTACPSFAGEKEQEGEEVADGGCSVERAVPRLGSLDGQQGQVMPGLYFQLGRLGKVPACYDIERDESRCYPYHLQLHAEQGMLVTLLQSYLTVVPNIQYEESDGSTGEFRRNPADSRIVLKVESLSRFLQKTS